jgi:hypothetical protein
MGESTLTMGTAETVPVTVVKLASGIPKANRPINVKQTVFVFVNAMLIKYMCFAP